MKDFIDKHVDGFHKNGDNDMTEEIFIPQTGFVYAIEPEMPQKICAKETNPKDLLGILKASTFYIPTQAVFEEGLVMLTGAKKYGPFNWREKGVKFSVYYDAARRHLDAFKERQNCDPESGLSHLAHVRACLGIIMDAITCGNMVDDRPKLGVLDIDTLNKTAESLVKKELDYEAAIDREIGRDIPVPGGY